MSKENARGMQDDAISRQVVLNEFCHSCDGWSCNPNTCCKTEWIRKLPTIHPEHGTDCISRQAAIDIAPKLIITLDGYEMHNQTVTNYCAEITQLPSAQPEIVRCKDCKYYRHGLCMKASMCVNKSENGFCDWARRREVTE